MVTQSRVHPVPLLLTRPKAQSAHFATAVSKQFGDQLRLVDSPLLAPRFFAPALPDLPFFALIITSKTGIEGYRQLGSVNWSLPKVVFCVGRSTGAAARRLGLKPLIEANDAADLIHQIIALRPPGPLLHLRGRDARGDVAGNLNNAGIDTKNVVIYAQDAQPFTQEAIAFLQRPEPVIVPLFSPRTAHIFTSEMKKCHGISPLLIVALSKEIALEATVQAAQIRIAKTPDAEAVLAALTDLLNDLRAA
jgi:uroporphyrinogen-III synthase